MAKKSSTKEFIRKSQLIHGNKYDYSEVNYTNIKTKVIIICPIHNKFFQRPDQHLAGNGCYECGVILRSRKHILSKEEFIKRAQKIHGKFYNYDRVQYINNLLKVEIVCPIHGSYTQNPVNHLRGKGCFKCGLDSRRKKLALTQEEFIRQSVGVHENKYDYSRVIYKNIQTKVEIICFVHGSFFQIPHTHLLGSGCPKCDIELRAKKHTLTTKEFIEKARKIHSDKYDYSKVDYINTNTKVIIICPIHGKFSQVPRNHLTGVGCPKCYTSKGEKQIRNFLKENNILFQEQYRILKCRNKKILSFDFAIFDENNNLKFLIEYQGHQHYKLVQFGGTSMEKAEKNFKTQQHRDLIKSNYCKDNHIPLVVIPYWEYNNIEDILSKHLKEIKVV